MGLPLRIGLATAAILLGGAAAALVAVSLGRPRRARVFAVPSRLPPELLAEVLRRPGPYEHH